MHKKTADSNISDENQLMESFSKSIKCGVMRIDKKNSAVCNINSCGCACKIIKSSKFNNSENRHSALDAESHEIAGQARNDEAVGDNYCFGVHVYAGEQSERFGGKYIYFCPAGFVFVVCPVILNGNGDEDRQLHG